MSKPGVLNVPQVLFISLPGINLCPTLVFFAHHELDGAVTVAIVR